MGVLDPSGPAEVKNGPSINIDIKGFRDPLIFEWSELGPINFY